MAYQILYSSKAAKSLDKIVEPFQSKIRSAIDALAENPRPFGYIKLQDREAYRIRVGNYRVIYELADNVLQVYVVAISDRKTCTTNRRAADG